MTDLEDIIEKETVRMTNESCTNEEEINWRSAVGIHLS